MRRSSSRASGPKPADRGARGAGIAILVTALALHAGAARLIAQQSSDGGSADAAEPARARPAPLLRPGDMVRLRIWREPDLSGDFPVDQDGVVVFPKIGAQRVTSQSPDQLRERLVAAYRFYLRNPSIDVVLLRRVNIRGAVRQPGLYTVDATTTLADAIALAGGSTPDGDMDRVEILRDGRRIVTRLSRDKTLAELPIQSGDQIFIPERSWISRNTGIVATVISASVSLFIALFTR